MAKFSVEARSRIMSAIKSKNTAPEVKLRKALWALGLRYKIHYGIQKVDIAFPSKKIAIFVDGDFWHGYDWKEKGRIPPKGFWQLKITNNIGRDKRQARELRKKGWKVLRFWEHDILQKPEKITEKVLTALKN